MSIADLCFDLSLVPLVGGPIAGVGHSSAVVVGGPLHGERRSLVSAVRCGPHVEFFASVPGPGGSSLPFWYRLCEFEMVDLLGVRWWVLVPRWVAMSRRRCAAFAPAVRVCLCLRSQRGSYAR